MIAISTLMCWHQINAFMFYQVAKLFQKIQEMVEEENDLVFVLIGEVSYSSIQNTLSFSSFNLCA